MIAMFALPIAVLMQADVAAPREPTSGWRLDKISGCTISRDFDRPDDPVTIGFRKWPAGKWMELIVVRKTSARPAPVAGQLPHVALGQTPITPAGWIYYFAAENRVMTLQLELSALAQLPTPTALTVTINGETPVMVRADGIQSALDRLSQCNSAAEQALGITPNEAASIATPAKGLTAWITADDYPPSALREGAAGSTAVLLRITPTGMVDECQIVMTSGYAVLDETTCRLAARRARYAPAVDASNKPVASHVFTKIHWSLPQ